MPPPARVCVACKTSKTRCVNFAPGSRCNRCERVGLRCELAPQRGRLASRAALGPSLRLLLDDSEDASSSMTSVPTAAGAATLSSAVVWLPASACGSHRLWTGMLGGCKPPSALGGFDVSRALLREMSAIARRRNSYGLMMTVIGLAREHDIALDELECADARPGVLQLQPPPRAAAPTMSEPIAAILATASGLCTVRTVDDGRAAFEANAAFAERVCTAAELQACWAENKVHFPTATYLLPSKY